MSLKLRKDDALLLVIDVQDRLAAAMDDEERQAVGVNAVRLLNAAELFEIPVLVSEQYPRGLGPTIPSVAAAFPTGTAPLAKMAFSCVADETIRETIAATGRKQIMIAGIETHVCVYQTARDLVAAGYQVFVAADAVTSRSMLNKSIGLSLIEQSGAIVTTTEATLFDLLETAEAKPFKAISRLVR